MNPYDLIRYPTVATATTHPDRLATNAILFGLTPAPVESCRVLEVGCGAGGNLIAMAFGLPGSRFLGIDLAESAIAEGRRTATELRLANIELRAMDLTELEGGEFDYIIAHGVYSWVPPAVRDSLLRICGAMLAPHGVAFVSYNVYPGCHMRNMLREMLLFHTNETGDPRKRIEEARAFMEWLKQAHPDDEFGHDLDDALKRNPAAVFHDDLSEVNAPVYFHQFMEHAARHGLQFLAEANIREMWAPGLPLPEVPVLREQYIDFARLRRFRRTLLCRADAPVAAVPAPERVRNLYASSNSHGSEPDRDGVVRFEGPKQSSAATTHPVAIAVLSRLGEVWPRRLAISDLAEGVEPAAVQEILLWGCHAGLVELHTYAPPFARPAGPRPVASALARLQLRTADRVTTLHHEIIDVTDPAARHMIGLLDGTRDRAALARECDVTLEAVEERLDRIAALPLLIA